VVGHLLMLFTPQMIRQFVLEFISPLALHHGQHLLAAAAHVWNERRQKSPTVNAKSVSLEIWKWQLTGIKQTIGLLIAVAYKDFSENSQKILRKVIKIVATGCRTLRLKSNKLYFS